MTDLVKAVAQSGALDEATLREIAKWRLPLELPQEDPYTTSEEAVGAIEAAMEGGSAVEVRSTSLDVLKQYLSTATKGKLRIVTAIETGAFPVTYGKTPLGAYLIPWQADSLTEHLTNGESYLQTKAGKVYFSDVQDLYFGERKVFIQCTPSRGSNAGTD